MISRWRGGRGRRCRRRMHLKRETTTTTTTTSGRVPSQQTPTPRRRLALAIRSPQAVQTRTTSSPNPRPEARTQSHPTLQKAHLRRRLRRRRLLRRHQNHRAPAKLERAPTHILLLHSCLHALLPRKRKTRPRYNRKKLLCPVPHHLHKHNYFQNLTTYTIYFHTHLAHAYNQTRPGPHISAARVPGGGRRRAGDPKAGVEDQESEVGGEAGEDGGGVGGGTGGD